MSLDFKKLLICLKEAGTRSSRLLITGHGNNVMSCEDVIIYQFLFFFFSQLVITPISSSKKLHCKN